MKPFQFKQFTIQQDKCAMKIGTDGVLLGSWTPLNNPQSILDIGAGTGVLALMLAQRSNAELIDALEIDEYAYEQCVENFENSPWADRLFCYHASLDEFAEEIDDTYDLIICNPPFYSEDQKSKNTQRDLARFQDALPFEDLIAHSTTLLSKDGIFSVILPHKETDNFIALAEKHKLHLNKQLSVKGNPSSPIKRNLLAFSFDKVLVEKAELTIETERHNYTQDYINLTKDFYLKM